MKYATKYSAFLTLTTLFFTLQILSILSLPYGLRLYDTDKYLRLAEQPLFSRDFLIGERPFGTSLVYKLLGANLGTADNGQKVAFVTDDPTATTIHLIQAGIHMVCWSLLAFFTGRIFRGRPVFSGAAILCVYLVGLSTPVLTWNRMLMSESLSFSTLAAILAAVLWVIESPRKWTGYLLLAFIFAFWINLRDTHILITLAVASMALLAAVIYRNPWAFLLATVLFGLYYVANDSFLRSRRWAIPMANVVLQRVLPDPNALDFFVARGMPVNQALLDLKGQWYCSQNCALSNSEALSMYWGWHIENVRSVYESYLLRDFSDSVTAPLLHVNEMRENFIFTSDWPGYFAPLPEVISSGLYAGGSSWQVLLALVGALFLAISRSWKKHPGLALFVCLMILAYPQGFLVYHGDAAEIARHALSLNIQVTLSFWIILLGIVETLFSSISFRRLIPGGSHDPLP